VNPRPGISPSCELRCIELGSVCWFGHSWPSSRNVWARPRSCPCSTRNFTGSPVMYLMGGRQYVLVAAASTAGPRRPGPEVAPASGPTGWVAYALPEPR